MYNENYHIWLCSQVSIQGPDYSYFLLMRDLDDHRFDAVVELDENRMRDAMELRRRYIDEVKSFGSMADEPRRGVSVLEVLIRLAERATFMADEEEDVSKWFWTFLRNLGLDAFTDDNYDDAEVHHIIWNFVNRRYTKTGKGGIFPLKHTKRDQRLLELWYQLAEYLHEQG